MINENINVTKKNAFVKMLNCRYYIYKLALVKRIKIIDII